MVMHSVISTIGDLKIGDFVIGPDGRPTRVLGKSVQRVPEKMFKMHMDVGALEVSDTHLLEVWYMDLADELKPLRAMVRRWVRSMPGYVLDDLRSWASSDSDHEVYLSQLFEFIEAKTLSRSDRLVISSGLALISSPHGYIGEGTASMFTYPLSTLAKTIIKLSEDDVDLSTFTAILPAGTVALMMKNGRTCYAPVIRNN